MEFSALRSGMSSVQTVTTDGKERYGNTMQYDQIKELIQIFEHSDLNNMEVTLGNASVKLGRGMANAVEESSEAQMVQTATTVETEKTEPAAGDKIVTAPIVGTFYRASALDQPPFVKVGDTIAKGDVVCIIEAMKFMNEVISEVDGTITEILVEDAQFVEFGQELFRVK